MSEEQKKKLRTNIILLLVFIILFAILSRFLQHNQTTLADLQNPKPTNEIECTE